jgi:16S rRNA (guanine527-N7)-methyltransferase
MSGVAASRRKSLRGRADPDAMAAEQLKTETAAAEDREQALSLIGDSVSRETIARLDRFAALLIERQKTLNLIARSTLPVLWTRHIADSLQLLPLASRAAKWVDLGSGAGFPGLVLACALVEVPGARVELVESIQKKAKFLRDVVDALSLPAIVRAERIEDFAAANKMRFDVVMARALAPMDKLLGYATPLLKKGAVGLFPKGQDVAAELTQASKSWNIEYELIPSITDPNGRIVRVQRAAKK